MLENQFGTGIEMPKYKCNKIVHALKISVMEIHENGKVDLAFEDKNYAPITVDDYAVKVKVSPEYDDTGYYVVYKGGYASWSPSEAFEEGYELIN